MFEYMIMPFQRYAEFSGRSRRMEYWSFILMNAVVFLVLASVAIAMGFSFSALSGGDFAGEAFGAGMMAQESLAIAKFLDAAELKGRRAGRWAGSTWKKMSTAARASLIALSATVAAAAVYLAWVIVIR